MGTAAAKKKKQDAPLVTSTLADAVASEDVIKAATAERPAAIPDSGTSPAKPRRTFTRRSKAQIEAEAEAARIARLDPIEARVEGRRRLQSILQEAEDNFELAQKTRDDARQDIEEFDAASKAKVGEFIAKARAELGLE